MLDNFYFQIWFSMRDGFTIDFYPLFQFQVDAILIAIIFASVVALRVRKHLKTKKRKFKK